MTGNGLNRGRYLFCQENKNGDSLCHLHHSPALYTLEYVHHAESARTTESKAESIATDDSHIYAKADAQIEEDRDIRNHVLETCHRLDAKMHRELVAECKSHRNKETYRDRHVVRSVNLDIIDLILEAYITAKAEIAIADMQDIKTDIGNDIELAHAELESKTVVGTKVETDSDSAFLRSSARISSCKRHCRNRDQYKKYS